MLWCLKSEWEVIDSPEVAAITAIGLDHTEELGDTIEKIAKTKSGIIKPGCSAVLYKQAESVTEIIRERCKETGVPLSVSEPEQVIPEKIDVFGITFRYPGFEDLLQIPLIGTYQLENVAVALKIIEALKQRGWDISEKDVKTGLQNTRWPARFEIVQKDPLFIVDGAHNPHGIRATKASIQTFFKDQKLIFLFGVMADKDYDDMLGQILPFAREVNCVTPDNPRALKAEELADVIRKKGAEAEAYLTIEEAVDSAIRKAKEQKTSVIALGSLYMIGDIKRYLKTKDKGQNAPSSNCL